MEIKKRKYTMRFMKRLISILLIGFPMVCIAEGNDDEIISKFRPSNLILDSTGSKVPVGQEKIYVGEEHIWVDLDGKGSNQYLLVGYQFYGSRGMVTLGCVLKVIKVIGKQYTLMEDAKLQFPEEVMGCNMFQPLDLDNDKKSEIIVYSLHGNHDGPPSVFRWDSQKLISITPTQVGNGHTFNSLKYILVSKEAIQGNILIVDQDPSDSTRPKKTYIMKDGKIILYNTHAWNTYLTNKPKKQTSLKVTIPEGEYILSVNNVSDHHKNVQAEIIVNGMVVLTSKDFCKAQPSPIGETKRPIDTDNDDACVPKDDVYAQVNLKDANDIKVRIFGASNSKIELTLDKK